MVMHINPPVLLWSDCLSMVKGVADQHTHRDTQGRHTQHTGEGLYFGLRT